MKMNEKFLKGLCISLGCIPFVGILIYSVYSCWDYFSISNYLFEIVYNLIQYPAVFFALGLIFLGAFIPFQKKEKMTKSNKPLWIILLVIGSLPFAAAIVTSIVRIFTSGDSIGDILGTLEWFSYIFWPLYVIGGFLIVLSALKLNRKILED